MYLLLISNSCTLFLNKILFYSPNHDNTSLHCNVSIHHGTSTKSLHRWRRSHSKTVQWQDYYNSTSIPRPVDGTFPTRRRQQDCSNIYPITCPIDKKSLTRRWQQDFFAAGISPLGEMSVRPANTIFPTQKHQCRHARILFLDRHTGVELSAMEFFHSESPLCCKDFFLSKPPFDSQLMGFFSLWAQTLAYGLPSFEPTSRWINPSIHIS